MLLAFMAISFLTVSCKHNDDPAPTSPPSVISLSPSITSLSPNVGVEGTEVVILGENFGDNTSEIEVTFGAKVAEITKKSSTELKVKAPSGLNDVAANVIVSVKGNRSNTKTFTYNNTAGPVIASITNTCFYGSTVVINGDNFSPNIGDNLVKFGTIEATVTAATKTSLTLTTPGLGDATTADVTVTKFNIVSNAKSIAVDVDQNKIATYNWATHTVKPGLTYKTGEFSLFGVTQRRVYVLDVTLNTSNTLGIGFTTTDVNTVTMCNNYNAVAGINAGYFPYNGSSNKDPYIRINAATVQNGHTDVSQLYTNSALLIHNNVATVKKFTESGKNLNLVAAAIPITQAENIIVCGPMLITSGTIETLDMSVGHNSSQTARTGLGVTADGKRIFMVVVDTGGGFTGVTTLQLAKILQALGSVNAMNFDGGGSSTMFVNNQGDKGRVNFPTGGTWQRPVRSVIYVK
ncbi:phosphodiester glycosidase family protein [Pedobacter heparinus]|uniref:phosphodiester glycosidase family protein n=1 Tax=Pedobacter heparinus TaxID=984 RepID=UPI00293057A4|nr:phosphodiester glycosidase family protein [Pedobacter heparinus]